MNGDQWGTDWLPSLKTVVVVGASLAGVSTIDELRSKGYDGRIVLIGSEQHLPYDRPPLSKEVLHGKLDAEGCLLRSDAWFTENAVDLELGSAAVSLDAATKTVVLASGKQISGEAVTIATGSSAVRIPSPRGAALYTLRDIDDALEIRDRLTTATKVAVIGAGFIGAEVASVARERGVEVVLLEAENLPLVRVLGARMGQVCMEQHLDHGVDLRCGVRVRSIESGGLRLIMDDGEEIEADFGVVGIGARPNTDWLKSSGLKISDGVVCDQYSRTPAPRIVAAGDVARWDHPEMGSVRIEHWDNAVLQGRAAAAALILGENDLKPYAPVPYVWSHQYGNKIQVVGSTRSTDEFAIVAGELGSDKFVAIYGKDGQLAAGLAVNRSKMVRTVRSLIAQRSSFDDAVATLT
jgi:NADPH-dependent 2,4-dienoyl-CoA reductase/sulfur reductase-like enzyme